MNRCSKYGHAKIETETNNLRVIPLYKEKKFVSLAVNNNINTGQHIKIISTKRSSKGERHAARLRES